MIYKYLSKERINVLQNATLRATQAEALNDPFELKPFFSEVLQKSELHDAVNERLDLEREIRNVYSELPAETRAKLPLRQLLALSKQPGFKKQFESWFGKEIDVLYDRHVPALTEMLKNLLYSKLGSNVGIVSFSDVPDETLMWSHYASDHKGFAIEFDDTHPFFDQRRSDKDEFFHLRPVEYPDTHPNYKSLSDLDGVKALCVKEAKWRHERERRMLVPVDPSSSDDHDEPIHLISFPRAAVRSVIVGARASNDLTDAIKSILAGHPDYQHAKLKVARAELSSGQMVVGDAG